jgi:hypothetical protein
MNSNDGIPHFDISELRAVAEKSTELVGVALNTFHECGPGSFALRGSGEGGAGRCQGYQRKADEQCRTQPPQYLRFCRPSGARQEHPADGKGTRRSGILDRREIRPAEVVLTAGIWWGHYLSRRGSRRGGDVALFRVHA